MTEVLIGIPTYNGYKRVDWLLQSIFMRTGNDIDYKIMICDDSGNKEHQEKTINVVDKWESKLPVSILINDSNMGVSKSWNRIIKSNDSKYIILINDDIIVAKNWLENMIFFLDNNYNIGVALYDCIFINEEDIQQLLSSANSIIIPRDQFTRKQIDNFNYYEDISPVRCIGWGCFFGFRRDIYDTFGKFDENYFAYFEEYDFQTNLASYGYPSYILRSPKNWHIWSATYKTAPELDMKTIFEKSRDHYIKKWKGDHTTVNTIYMNRIPIQKIKWINDNNIYEENK